MEHIRENFIQGMRLIMAREDMNSDAEFGAWLGVSKQTIYQIKNATRMPTVEQIYTLCEKGDVNANWLIRNVGQPMMSEAVSMAKLYDKLNTLEKAINKRL